MVDQLDSGQGERNEQLVRLSSVVTPNVLADLVRLTTVAWENGDRGVSVRLGDDGEERVTIVTDRNDGVDTVGFCGTAVGSVVLPFSVLVQFANESM